MRFQGKAGLIWFTGIVEDRNDPLFLNRVRVRIYGVHTHDKQLIATPDLPWSEVLMPTTSPSLSGMGTTTHGLVEGSTVMGFWRDGLDLQDSVVMGSFIGIPQKFSRVDETIDDSGVRSFTKIDRASTEGFNDPRLAAESAYDGTPDGKNPKHINRNYGLTLALDKSPKLGGTDAAVSYPREVYMGMTDVNLLAVGIEGENKIENAYPVLNQLTGEPDRADYLKPKYPFNHVHESESGHVIELDDTPDYERIHLFHRKGTRIEIDKDGSYVERVVKDKYSVILGDDTITVTGNVTINVKGNVDLTAEGNVGVTATDVNIVSSKHVKVLASTTADIVAAKAIKVQSIDKVKIQ
jgi:hypothetical protein